MAIITIIQNDYITITCDTDHKIMHHVIHKPIDGKSLRTALASALDVMEKYKATKWLSDDRLNGELDYEDQEWIFNEFPRRAMSAGWKTWAIVVPQEVAGRASMVDMVFDYSQRGVTTRVFVDTAEALKWLEAV